MKCIPISNCNDCPHKEHRGGFGNPAYRPYCGNTAKRSKNLPYTEGIRKSGFGQNVIVAEPTGVIPDWCPLEDR